MNVVGIDKDFISLKEAKELKEEIIRTEKCQVILYQTKRGMHFQLIFDKKLNQKECFALRKKYGDCKTRLSLSKMRSKLPEVPTDILFARKNGIWRRRVW